VDSGGYNIVDSGRNLNTLNSGVPLLTLYQAAMKTWLFPSSVIRDSRSEVTITSRGSLGY